MKQIDEEFLMGILRGLDRIEVTTNSSISYYWADARVDFIVEYAEGFQSEEQSFINLHTIPIIFERTDLGSGEESLNSNGSEEGMGHCFSIVGDAVTHFIKCGTLIETPSAYINR